MDPSGIIFAALDCDADAIETWNRWYDLEHTPMNVCLDGVMLSRRYVATPELHAARLMADGSPFAGGRATFLTTYVLGGDPQIAFDAMSVELPKLYEDGRMTFPAAKKVVREGDVFAGSDAVGRAVLQLRPREVPFVGHTGVIVVQRREDDGRAAKIAELDGVTGVWSMASRNRPGLFLDMIFVEDDPAGRAVAIRAAVPHTTEFLVDAPYLLINPMSYPWADAIRDSDLPRTIA
ncbi:MAG: hypothetical protein JWM34_5094 [Ilumatobacteraceae bacterium]|nr:hypothetical protein [Ilumatobacteraceae bacterium]